MGFSLNPITLIKQEVLKIGAKKGQAQPPVITALEDVEKGAEHLGALLSKLTPADIALIISFVPQPIKDVVLAKVPAADLAALEAAVISLPSILAEAESFIKQAEVGLQS